MPVIPGGNENQVLNPGSPVNAISATEERMFGEAIADLGSSLFKLGLHKQEKEKRDTIGETLLHHELQAIVEKERAASTVSSVIPNDPTGNQQVQAFRTRTQEAIKEYLDKNEDYSPEVRRGALARIGEDIHSSAQFLGANELKKIADKNEADKHQGIIKLGSEIAIDPSKTEENLNKIELITRQAPKNPALVDAEVRNNGATAIKVAISENINSQVPDFNSAHKLLDMHGEKYLSPDELTKFREDINQGDYKYTQRLKSKLEYQRTLSIRAKEESQQKMALALSEERVKIGNDEAKLSAYMRTLDNAVMTEEISQAQYDKIVKQTAAGKLQDDQGTVKYRNMYASGVDPDKVRPMILNDPTMSSAAKAPLLKEGEQFKNLDPKVKDMISQTRTQIRGYLKSDPIFAGSQANLLDDSKFRNVVNTAASDFTRWAQKNPDKIDYFSEKANEFVRTRLRMETNARGATNQQKFGTPEKVQEEMDRVIRKSLEDKRNGKPVDRAKLERELKALKIQKDTLNAQKEVKEATKQEGTSVQSGEF